MKVFAEYFVTNGEPYRRKTLLKFGESINLIGSAVLINPGSANPKGPSDLNFVKEFYRKNHNEELSEHSCWKAFYPDATMRQIEKLFNGWYLGNEEKLNGVIQLFNCFYYKEQNLDKAIRNLGENNSMIFGESYLLRDKPVYFGWGNAGKSRNLKSVASDIFNSYDIKITPIYKTRFE